MSMTKEEIRKLSMFYPKTKRGLLVDYPELEKIDVFRSMNKQELLFAWYFGCRSSPFEREEDIKIKVEKCLVESYGERLSETLKGKYIAGNFPDKLREGIAQMQKFQIGPRVRSKMMVEKIMSNYAKLIEIDVKTEFLNKDKEEDWTKKKAYIDSCAKISATLPILINQSEGGFGIIEKEDGEVIELESENLIDEFHATED